MNQALEIHHPLAEVIVKPVATVNQKRLKNMICSSLDEYLYEDRVPAQAVHDEAKERHGAYYRSTGYHLRLYRQRAELTQAALAGRSGIRQHHLSEMENNRRPLGKANARKLAEILDCDYRRLL